MLLSLLVIWEGNFISWCRYSLPIQHPAWIELSSYTHKEAFAHVSLLCVYGCSFTLLWVAFALKAARSNQSFHCLDAEPKGRGVLKWLVTLMEVIALNRVTPWQQLKCCFKMYLFIISKIKFALNHSCCLLCSSGNTDSQHWLSVKLLENCN